MPTLLDMATPEINPRPYPGEYISRFISKAGVEFTVRPIRPDDEPMMVKFHRQLSERSVYYRYFSLLKLSLRTSHERLITRCSIDYEREMALVAEHRDAGCEPVIVGIARMIREQTGNTAEVAFIVADEFQRQGLGTHFDWG